MQFSQLTKDTIAAILLRGYVERSDLAVLRGEFEGMGRSDVMSFLGCHKRLGEDGKGEKAEKFVIGLSNLVKDSLT